MEHRKKSSAFVAPVIMLATLIALSAFGTAHAAGSAGQPIPFAAVTIEPDHSMRSTGYVFQIDLQAASAGDSDMVIDGPCTVNGADVASTLDNRTDGLYYLTYIVGANDHDAASGTIPISCTLTSPSTGDVVTATHFTDPNTAGVDPDFVSNVQAQSDGPTSETIIFTTAFPTSGDIEYSYNGVMQTTPREPTFGTTHSIVLSNLLPGTAYVYEVVATTADDVEGTSPELLPFTTASGNTGGGENTGGSNNGTSTSTDLGTLAVTSITPIVSAATADGSFQNGWEWIYNITIPSNQSQLRFKFSDWSDANDDSMSTAGNVRISSPQAVSMNPVTLNAANTYSEPLTINADNDPNQPGNQIEVIVQTSIPPATASGSYSATYAIDSN